MVEQAKTAPIESSTRMLISLICIGELSKILLGLSAGLLAFTTSFPPALTAIQNDWLLAIVWGGLAASLVGGLFNLYGWEKFYITYRDCAADKTEGDRRRKKITLWRRTAHFLQFAGFGLGVLALAWFVISNRTNIKLAEKPRDAATASPTPSPTLSPKGAD